MLAATLRRSLTASTSRLLPAVQQSCSFRPLTTTPAAALHESLPLDPLPSASSSSAAAAAPPVTEVLTAASEVPLEDEYLPMKTGLTLLTPSAPNEIVSWPSADELLSASPAKDDAGRAVDLINSQPRKYVQVGLYHRKYLLHAKDVLTLPRLKPAPAPGSKLALTRVFEVGSHDYALKAQRGSRLTGVRLEATVLEHTTSPMEFTHKKKRRKGYKLEIRSKMRYTRLRIGEIVVEGAAQAKDLEAPERKLDRPVSKPFDQYNVTDQTLRGRLARHFGVVDYGKNGEFDATQKPRK